MTIKSYISFFLIIASLVSCVNSLPCKIIQRKFDIKVSDLLINYTDENGNIYCEMVKRSIEGDHKSFKELIRLQINDGASYDHGNIIVKIIIQIEEITIVDMYRKKELSEVDIKLIRTLIEVGLEYGDSEFQGKIPQDVFPMIFRI